MRAGIHRVEFAIVAQFRRFVDNESTSYMTVGLVRSDLDIVALDASTRGFASYTGGAWAWAAHDGHLWHKTTPDTLFGLEWPEAEPSLLPWGKGDTLGLEYDADNHTLAALLKKQGEEAWEANLGLLVQHLPTEPMRWTVELWSVGDRAQIARRDEAFVVPLLKVVSSKSRAQKWLRKVTEWLRGIYDGQRQRGRYRCPDRPSAAEIAGRCRECCE